MAKYLKVDSRKITLREYWNIGPRSKLFLPILAKLLRIPLPFGSGFRQPDSVQELQVPESEFPPSALTFLQPLMEECLALGFHSPRYYCFSTLKGETRTSFISMLYSSGEFSVRLMHTAPTSPQPPAVVKDEVLVAPLSELADGTWLVSTNKKPRFDSPASVVTNRIVGAPVATLIGAHQKRLTQLSSTNPAKLIHTLEAMDEVWDRYEKASSEFGIKRGRYVEIPAQELEDEQHKLASIQTMTDQGVENAAVLAEMAQLQNKKGGWGNALVIFLISMFMFLGAGSRQGSWKSILLLIPILFVHEMGHYLTMRAFNYRNLRMFFIPFFGAAVTGRHYNVPGWKKVVVSLMGPVPGIIIGAILGVVGLIFDHPGLTEVAFVTLLLNGSNLLPVLPFDGGWVVHALLFSRHPLFDVIFRGLAVLALIAIGLSLHLRTLAFIAIPMAMGIPTAYRMARITTGLRKMGIEPTSSDDQTVPAHTAQTIINEVRKSSQTPLSDRLIAQQSLDIFEQLNARPPGWLATLALLFVHGASILGAAIVFVILIAVGSGALNTPENLQPQHALVCGSISAWSGSRAGDLRPGHENTIVATLPEGRKLGATFQTLTTRMPSTASLTLLGDTLLLALPSNEDTETRTWLQELRGVAEVTFLDNTNSPARFTLTCTALNTNLAESLKKELAQYLSNSEEMLLIPPWMPDHPTAPKLHEQHLKARDTFAKAQRTRWAGLGTPALKTLSKAISQARKEGDQGQLEALQKQKEDLTGKIQSRNLETLRNGSTESVDTALLELYSSLPVGPLQANLETKVILQKMAERMGQLPLTNGLPSAEALSLTTQSGWASSTNLQLTLVGVSFTSISHGAPALVNWLCANGCTNLKYDFIDSSATDEEEKD